MTSACSWCPADDNGEEACMIHGDGKKNELGVHRQETLHLRVRNVWSEGEAWIPWTK